MMITIRLFGILREHSIPDMFTIEAKTVREALDAAARNGVDSKLLRGALIFINGSPLSGVGRLSRRLSDGDEIALLSPAGGG